MSKLPYISWIILPVLCLLCSIHSAGQITAPLTIRAKDSLSAIAGERFLYNNITLTNNTKSTASYIVQLDPPKGWRYIYTQKEVVLAPGSSVILPLSLMPSPEVPAVWYPFSVTIRNSTNGDSAVKIFYVKNVSISRYTASVLTKSFLLTSFNKKAECKVYLSNTGNVEGVYTVSIRNYTIGMDSRLQIKLPAGGDSLITVPINIPSEAWKLVQKENLSIKITDSIGTVKLLSAEITKAASSAKDHISAYATLPVTVETGIMQVDDVFTYFAAFKSTVELSEKRRLNIDYRTRDFGRINQLQQNVFNINYTDERLDLRIGQITEAKNFINFGNGIKAEYKLNNDKKIFLSGSIHRKNDFYADNNLEVGYSRLKNKIRWTHSLAANHNTISKEKNFIAQQTTDFYLRDNINLSANVALGYNGFKGYNTSGFKNMGSSLGYTFRYRLKRISVGSTVQENSAAFPGINGGLKSQNHQAGVTVGKRTWQLFYQSNQSRLNIFRDTLYNSDLLSFNLRRYGLGTSFSFKRASYQVNAGKFKQVGAGTEGLNNYHFVENSVSVKPGAGMRLSLYSFAGFGPAQADKGGTAWTVLTSGNLQYKFAGFSALYTSNPLFAQDSTQKFIGDQKSLNFIPSVNLTLLKRLHVGLNYNISKSLYDKNKTSFLGGNISYNGGANHTSVQLTGMLPITRSQVNALGLNYSYFNLSVKKLLNVPLLHKKRYVKLRVVPFDDRNNNSIKESGEPALSRIQVDINSIPFVSDKAGSLQYNHITKGKYTLDFGNAAGPKGLVPAGGMVQQHDIKKNTILSVPFKKSRLITGRILVELDSLSSTPFTPDGLKVVARDSAGHEYLTLADANGQFYFNVPAGVYSVALNPEAFNEKLAPETFSFSVNLVNEQEQNVQFLIKQQKRKIRLLKSN